MSILDQVVRSMVAEYETPVLSLTVNVKPNVASKPRANPAAEKLAQAADAVRYASPQPGNDPSHNGREAEVALPILPKGSLDAVGFIKALRGAKSRNEKIQAIQAFMGYDPSLDFGGQEMQATMLAKRMIRPIDASGPTRSEQRSAACTLQGFVKGMPDYQAKEIGNLLAREAQAVESRAEFLKAASTECPNLRKGEQPNHDGSCCMHHAKAEVEVSRLSFLRADLNRYGRR